ncbi:hypothetical protein [Kineococcus auxinigenes]|uniref:hypothetical protein n=1 Tax=unclassified Kineococcus TaxID=2621656 RepID=UPI003D7C9556
MRRIAVAQDDRVAAVPFWTVVGVLVVRGRDLVVDGAAVSTVLGVLARVTCAVSCWAALLVSVRCRRTRSRLGLGPTDTRRHQC